MTDFAARLARIEAGLEGIRELTRQGQDAIREAITHGDNTSAQLVALLGARVDSVKHDLTAVANSDRDAHAQIVKQLDEHDTRITAVERFNARLIGFGIGISVATGSATAAVLKVLGA